MQLKTKYWRSSRDVRQWKVKKKNFIREHGWSQFDPTGVHSGTAAPLMDAINILMDDIFGQQSFLQKTPTLLIWPN